MTVRFVLGLCIPLVLLGVAPPSWAARVERGTAQSQNLHFAVPGEGVVLSSSVNGHALRARESAGPDTFALFGYRADPALGEPDPPFSAEAKFQDALTGLSPIDLGTNQDPTQGWITVDLTDQDTYWQVSEFNAANLGGNGAGNLAAWCGQSAAQQPGWSNAPGYGNNWFDVLLYSVTVPDPTVGETVGLDFFFNHDVEPGYDFFEVQYDSAGQWITVLALDGSNKDASNVFAAPGARYSELVGTRPIVYTGNDFGGDTGDAVRIRMVVDSDDLWSDEDGLWPTSGAVQVDDITVTSSAGVSFTDFEGGFADWSPDKVPFAGDFAAAYARLTDLDPCNDNTTPVAAFVDRGQVVNNAASAAQIPGYPTSTGGTTSGNWSYGFPGGWVVNYNGGVSFGEVSLSNEIWSREIAWDLPTTLDDNPGNEDIAGAFLAFDRWTHLPLGNGIFYVWHVRSTADGNTWTGWQDRNFVYYGGGVAAWGRTVADVSSLLLSNPVAVQLALGVVDLAAAFGFGGADATPSPAFDNVGFVKYRIQGPVHAASAVTLAQDGFPPSGSIDASTQSARDALDVPFDTAGTLLVAGALAPWDSITVELVSSIPGAIVADTRMKWALIKNPLFEDAIRQAPNRIRDENVDTTNPVVWFGEVVGDSCRTGNGAVVDDRFFYDLPDVDFIYPGDVLHYYIESTDSDGRVTTFPANTSGFGDVGGGYVRSFIVRGLPSIRDAAGTQPTKLVWNDFGRRGGENDFVSALGQLGFVEGLDYDTFTTEAPSSAISNGLGSAGGHGANADQLAGYDTVVYLGGNLSSFLLSNGTGQGQNDGSDDLGVMTAWKSLSGPRNSVYFADYMASALVADSAEGGVYVQTILGVQLNDPDVRDEIDSQTAPLVRPLDAAFATEFVAFGGCQAINQFDSITPLAPATRGHGFVDPGGSVYPSLAASVIHQRTVDGATKIDVTFPYGLIYVYNPSAKAPGAASARAELLREVFDLFSVPSGGNDVVSVPQARVAQFSVFPNPFNPATTLRLRLPHPDEVQVRIHDLRGRLVRELYAGDLEAGERSFVWKGRDDRGVSVASGVYLAVVRSAGGVRLEQKIALVR